MMYFVWNLFLPVVPCLSPVSWDPLLNKPLTRRGSLSQALLLGELRHHHVPALPLAILFCPLAVSTHYNPRAKCCPPTSYCVNKVLLKPNQAHLCTIYSGTLTTVAEVRGCNKEHMVHKASNIYTLALYRNPDQV